jgi:SAM-dependent methyltransferase
VYAILRGYEIAMSSSYRLELDKWLSQLDVKAERVLDIGGSQLPVKGRTNSWDVKTYLIADLPEPHVGSPKPDIEIDLNYQRSAEGNQFDLIFCLEVFDYIFDPMSALNNLNSYLKPNGTAWVTFPSFYPLHQPVEDDALRYMPGGIVKLAENAGLSVEQMIMRRPETDMLMQTWRAERMRAAKHEDHEFTGFIVEFKK